VKLRNFFSLPKRRELDEELQFHFEALVEQNITRGLSREEARRQARVAFGDMERAAEQTSGQYPGWWLDTLGQDLRYALRGLRRNLVFAIAAVATLALGIGATTAVFSVVDRILFRSLPYAHDDRVVSVGLTAPIMPQEFALGGGYYIWKDHQTPFESFSSWSGVNLCELSEVNPARLACAFMESDFLPTFGVSPLRGRNFTADEDVPNAPRIGLISYGLWKNRYGLSENILGRTMSIDGEDTRIVGVLPQDFELPNLQHADVVLPQRLDEAVQRRSNPGRVLFTFARLKPGVSIPQAIAQLQPLFQDSLNSAPPRFRSEVHLLVRSIRDYQVHDARLTAWVLLGAVLAVLLIAGANVSGLLLARAAERESEFAIRKSLGASRWRLLSQMLTEALLLSILGIIVGCGVGWALLKVFVSLAPKGIPYIDQAHLDGRVLGFAIAIALLSGIAFGSAPLWSVELLRERVFRNVTGAGRARARQALLVAQLSVTLMLLAAAGLLLRTERNLQARTLGIRTGQVVTATVHFGRVRYPDGVRRLQFANQLEDRLKQIPGVNAIAVSDTVPPGGLEHDQILGSIAIAGRPKPEGGTGGRVAWRWVSPGYFSTLGIRITRGQDFTEEERQSTDHFVILSESMAARLFPGEDPIGQHVDLNSNGVWYTVVGVAADAKNGGLATESEPEYYRLRRNRAEDWNGGFAAAGGGIAPASFILGTPASAQALASLIRSTVATVDNAMPVELQTMGERVSSLAERPRFEAALLSLFAVLAIALAAIGLYGVLAFIVSRRSQEIAVHMALGAGKQQIIALIGREGIRMMGLGILLGGIGTLSISRAFRALLFGVSANDVATLVSAVTVLALVGLIAMWVPLRRAISVDPMQALRYE
jgi:predicted permease